MPGLALESARIWHEADPASPQAMQAVSILLVGAKRAATDTEKMDISRTQGGPTRS